MERRPFGPSGESVSAIGQGTWKLRRPDHAEKALQLGLDLGLTHIDTAELYRGSEEVVARAIRDRRSEVFLVSKVLPRNATYAGTLKACEASLSRLRTDHLDVYLIHWWEDDLALEDCLRAMGELADAGKIRYIGVSNFDVAQVEAAQALVGRRRIVCDQVYYSPERREVEHELIPFCRQKDVAVVAYSPFGSGRFPGPGTSGGKALVEVARRAGLTPHQVVLNFLARFPHVFPIPKAETEAHVRENAGALDRALSKEDLAQLEAAFPLSSSRELPII